MISIIIKVSGMFKTISFAIIHFFNAFTIAYLLSGSLLIGGLVALIEPSVNTIAYYIHERVWLMRKVPKVVCNTPFNKTLSFTIMHFSVAIAVVYSLTGDWMLSSLVALIEPCVNSFAYYIHENVWQKMEINKGITA